MITVNIVDGDIEVIMPSSGSDKDDAIALQNKIKETYGMQYSLVRGKFDKPDHGRFSRIIAPKRDL